MTSKCTNLALVWGINACRFLVAFVLLFSGFVKAIDPWGNAYKIEEYLRLFPLKAVAGIGSLSLSLSVVQSVLEFFLGACLFWGFRRRLVSLLSFLLFCFFTVVTFYLAVYNPISDCGCFGDVIHLTNWQTFYKNIGLLLCTVLLPLYPQKQIPLSVRGCRWGTAIYSLLFVLFVSAYSSKYLPIVDWGGYHEGVNLRKAIGENKKENAYEYVLEKDGVRKVFASDAYPDSSWTFIEARPVAEEQESEGRYSDFCITEEKTGREVTDSLLHYSKGSFWLVTPRVETMDDSSIDRINDIQDYCKKYKIPFGVLTASDEEVVSRWKDDDGISAPVYWCEESVLKSLIRSNPGLVFLENGKILKKWSSNDLPENELLQWNANPEEHLKATNPNIDLVKCVLWYFVPIFLMSIFVKFVRYRRKNVNPIK